MITIITIIIIIIIIIIISDYFYNARRGMILLIEILSARIAR